MWILFLIKYASFFVHFCLCSLFLLMSFFVPQSQRLFLGTGLTILRTRAAPPTIPAAPEITGNPFATSLSVRLDHCTSSRALTPVSILHHQVSLVNLLCSTSVWLCLPCDYLKILEFLRRSILYCFTGMGLTGSCWHYILTQVVSFWK